MVYFGCCHLLVTDALYLIFPIALQALVSWWGKRLKVDEDCGSLVCTICYPCNMYTSTTE